MSTGNIFLGVTLQWTSTLTKGECNIHKRFMSHKASVPVWVHVQVSLPFSYKYMTAYRFKLIVMYRFDCKHIPASLLYRP